MKQALGVNGLPFSGSLDILDLRSLDASQNITRYVTLFARNLNVNTDVRVTATLVGGSGSTIVAQVDIPAADSSEVTILRSFPVSGAVRLSVSAPVGAEQGAMCYGFYEFDTNYVPGAIACFQPAALVSPFSVPTGQLTTGVVTLLQPLSSESVQEISLTIDTPDDEQLELRFYSSATAYNAFTFNGQFAAYQVLDRIPMFCDGSIRAKAVTSPPAGKSFAVYGTTIWR